MSSCNAGNLTHYLSNFSGQDPIRAIQCPYTADAGAGMGLPVFALFLFGGLGLGLAVRTQHPGPLIIGMILSVAAITPAIPGIAGKILAIVFFFAIAGFGYYIYQRAQSSL
jgi:hypothetical protein